MESATENSKLIRIGHSTFVSIPADFLHLYNLKRGDYLTRQINGDKIILGVQNDRN